MWTFIFLSILGLNVCQANGQENSTQIYYAKLTIEANAIDNITQILQPFVSNTTLKVDDLKITTTCQNVSTDTECTCNPGYIWSNEACNSNDKCTFPQNSARMCVSDTAVTIKGSVTLDGLQYYDCLRDKESTEFKECNNKLFKQIKTVYSTLSGFEILKIIKYREGSVIADFEVTIAYGIMTQDLIQQSENLSKNLSASLNLETAGVVSLAMPPNPVCYDTKHTLNCTVREDLGTPPVWQLNNKVKVFDITNGTMSNVITDPLKTEVRLERITELWAGQYTCAYLQKSGSNTISHKASAVMSVSLLPNIDITTTPEFPRCQNGSKTVKVRANCVIGSSNESYTVEWAGNDYQTQIQKTKLSGSDGTDVYVAETTVDCSSTTVKPQLNCTFRNRCNQMRSALIEINIIHANDLYCAADGDWQDTKAGFTAVLKCKNAAGQRQRECKLNSNNWEPESSACVNWEVSSLLESANIVDIGLGLLDENAAHVFSRLEGITNNTEIINSFANMNASVHVLFSLSQKLNQINNESAVNDLLESSSNLLARSLEESWKANADKDNLSLAERYLNSVEHLIQVTNITDDHKKKNLEVSASNCTQGFQCTVFNATVVLDSSNHGSVKTAGFKELDSYLPNKNENFKPNSIVVSATTEKRLDSVEVKINFPLVEQRGRNVEMMCVSWDNITRSWSSLGCDWEGPSDEGSCVCKHLSSFAILMSKYPLEVPGMTEITYVGLSISVMSLIISLAIELTVWNAVVKTNTLYLRHTAHINISLCLLVADCCFLASSKPKDISEIWCKIFVLLKHFCYLSMFFWMLCLSSTLLHQAVYLFHNVSKKIYLRYSLVLGYACPLLIVAITFFANTSGAEGLYYSKETCWLVYTGLLKGSIHTFVLPVGTIVFINVFSMLVVIMKLLDHPKNNEKTNEKEKKAAKTVVRSVILLTPIFGVTWIFGFAVMLLDLTSGPMAYIVHYAFTLLNAFQGLFILLTTCLGDKLTREALLNHLKHKAPALTNDSSTKSTWK